MGIAAQIRMLWQAAAEPALEPVEKPTNTVEWMRLAPKRLYDMAPDDPLLSYFIHNPGVIEVSRLPLESPVSQALRDAGVELVVPLVSQGQLIGLLNLGPRRAKQHYSNDVRRLLAMLSTQAASALRVAQLVQEREAEAVHRERLEHELRVARRIQQTLVPKDLPSLPGWEMAAHYQPAYAVGGDFYDFIELSDGRLVLFVADVSDKGIPAALVMATTRGILRGSAKRLVSPAAVLERANDLLSPELPSGMFVTCFCAVLDPASGDLRYANAGQNIPYRSDGQQVAELRATGMPLGLLPDMHYEEFSTQVARGETLFFYSDGLTEAHNRFRDMFGDKRLQRLLRRPYASAAAVVDGLLGELAHFGGAHWQQEDDLTLLAIRRGEEAVDER